MNHIYPDVDYTIGIELTKVKTSNTKIFRTQRSEQSYRSTSKEKSGRKLLTNKRDRTESSAKHLLFLDCQMKKLPLPDESFIQLHYIGQKNDTRFSENNTIKKFISCSVPKCVVENTKGVGFHFKRCFSMRPKKSLRTL